MSQIQLFEIGDGVWKAVAQSFGRTEKSLEDDVKKLEEWMKTQHHLPEIMDKQRIKNFLILNKCSIEQTKLKIDMYYTVRTLMDDVFEISNPKLDNMKKVLDTMYCIPLPKLTKEMNRVIVLKVRNKKLMNEFDPYDGLRHVNNVQELRLKEDVTFKDIYIVDATDITLNYFLKLTPTLLFKTVVVLYQRVYSSRFKGAYMLNVPPALEKILAILKTMLKPELFERIHICQDRQTINEIFPKEMIPKDFGGEEKSLDELQDILKLKLMEYQDRFDRLDDLRVNEKLRPEKLENDDILGVYGNFRKLDLD